jgi:prepilin peptidase CpaA
MQTDFLFLPPLFACAFVLAAAWIDCRERRIPNRLVLAGLCVAFATRSLVDGWGGLGSALGGLAVGLALLVPIYAVGGMGAGDAKLMGMVGAFLGPWGVLSAAVLTFLSGGVLAVAVALRNRSLGRTLGNTKAMLLGSLVGVVALRKAELAVPAVGAGTLPYGVAIAVGTLLYVALASMGVEVL